MSTPRDGGGGGWGADQDPERTAEPAAWGSEPPGGWGRPDPDEGWGRPDPDHGWGRPEEVPEHTPWGASDHASDPEGTARLHRDDRYRDDGHPDDRYRDAGRHPDEDHQPPDDRYPDAAADQGDVWDDDGAARFTPGDEPWAPRAVARRRRARTGRAALIGGVVAAVVVVAVVLVLLFWMPGWAVTRTLDRNALQNGVTQVLTQSYGLRVDVVECPDDVVVRTGQEFTCQAVVDGEQVPVPGRVTSDIGDYQIARV